MEQVEISIVEELESCNLAEGHVDSTTTSKPMRTLTAIANKTSRKRTCLRDAHNMLLTIRSNKYHACGVRLARTCFSKGRELGECVRRSRHSERTCCCISVCSDEEAVPRVSGSGVEGHNTRYQLKLGQYVQHALIKAETQDNLKLVIESFQSYNPTWKNIIVFATDKAFHEKDVLLEMFRRLDNCYATCMLLAKHSMHSKALLLDLLDGNDEHELY
ncbi:hypothetical protein GQ600_13055 [Phytophthora cactorum]|nr:hypothetical protein GQ600_13055 [Phytophthora cactorum]